MNTHTLLDVLAKDDGSVDSVLKAIEQLREELLQGKTEDWENPTLEQFLEAMHAWLTTMGPRIEGKPSWKFVEGLVRAAKIYE